MFRKIICCAVLGTLSSIATAVQPVTSVYLRHYVNDVLFESLANNDTLVPLTNLELDKAEFRAHGYAESDPAHGILRISSDSQYIGPGEAGRHLVQSDARAGFSDLVRYHVDGQDGGFGMLRLEFEYHYVLTTAGASKDSTALAATSVLLTLGNQPTFLINTLFKNPPANVTKNGDLYTAWVQVPLDVDLPYTFSAGGSAATGVSVYGPNPAALYDASHTLIFGGMNAMTFNGQNVDFEIYSQSGYDWKQSHILAVPENPTYLMLLAGLVVLGVCRLPRGETQSRAARA